MVDITGDYIEIHDVADLGGTGEAETLLAQTKGTVSINEDVGVAETREHNNEQSKRKAVRFDHTVGFEGTLTSDAAALQTLGLIAAGSPFTLKGFGTAGKDIRVKVFENKGDASAAQELICKDSQFTADSLEYTPEEFAQWSGELLVNGDIDFETGVS